MITTIQSAVLDNVRPVLVTIEAWEGGKYRGIQIRRKPSPGLAEDGEFFKEARIRVESALGLFERPCVDVTVTFADNFEPRRGQCIGLDLPIALAVASVAHKKPLLVDTFAYGELSLGGQIRTVRGGFQAAELALSLGKKAILRAESLQMPVCLVVDTLTQAIDIATSTEDHERYLWPDHADHLWPDASAPANFSDIALSPENHRRVAAAVLSGLGITLVGKPGSGRTMLARRLGQLLPELSPADVRTLRRTYSAAAMMHLHSTPFRAPHHTASASAFTGRGVPGAPPRPGECALAHKGVLFLDELTEYRRDTLETLHRELSGIAMPSSAAPSKPAIVVAAFDEKAHVGSVDRIEGFRAVHCPVWIHLPHPAAGIRKDSGMVRAELALAATRTPRTDPAIYENAPQGPNVRFERTLRLARALAQLDASESVTQAHLDEALGFLENPIAKKENAR